jgi:predicted DNA-binding transcriptional regulator AlpA
MITSNPKPTGYLKPLEAAQYLRSSPSTLAKLRLYGGGPTYSRIGRAVRYRLADLDAWMDLRRSRSTSETVQS